MHDKKSSFDFSFGTFGVHAAHAEAISGIAPTISKNVLADPFGMITPGNHFSNLMFMDGYGWVSDPSSELFDKKRLKILQLL